MNKRALRDVAIILGLIGIFFVVGGVSAGGLFQASFSLGTLSDGLVAHYTFDGVDTDWGTNITNNTLASASTGALQNMSTSSSPGDGIVGQSLKFDSVNTRVFVGNAPTLNTSEGTVCAWIYPTAYPDTVFTASRGSIFEGWQAGTDVGFLGLGTTGFLHMGQFSGDNTISSQAVILDTWNHACGVWDSTDFYTYQDGALTSNGGTGVMPTDLDEYYIGLPLNSASGHSGFIDEVRVYDRALSAGEIARLHGQGAGAKAQESFTARDASAPVAHWTFDGIDTNWRTNLTNDISANGNHGLLASSSTTTSPVEGVLGQALQFEGTTASEIITQGQFAISGSQNRSVAMWFRTTDSSQQTMLSWGAVPVGNGERFSLEFESGDVLSMPAFLGNRRWTVTGYDDGEWHHVVMILDGTSTSDLSLYYDGELLTPLSTSVRELNTTASDLHIGIANNRNTPFEGSLDDIRIYDRAISESEAVGLYRAGVGGGPQTSFTPERLKSGLVGHWTFDGADTNWGTNTTSDQSPSGNNGALVSMSTTSSPAEGILGQALKFDGVDDYVNTGTGFLSASAGTVALWMRPDATQPLTGFSVGSNSRIFSDTNGNLYLEFDENNQIVFVLFDGATKVTGNVAINTDNWNLLVASWDSTNAYLSVNNGPQVSVAAGAINNVAGNFSVGAHNAGSLHSGGLIDDLRVYNRALSASEISQLYNLGN